ncbi:MAG: protein kinase, partial [Gammaproteobacteria bacterium]
MSLAPGTRFGAYEIGDAIGAGGMGEVYRATDTNLKRDVAVKVLPATFAEDADRVARFKREAEVLASLNHANIAQIYGLEKADGQTVIVMELVEGPTLANRIAQGPIPADEALGIAQQVADALEAAHGAQVVHRDLKPENIKLKPGGTIKVLDFGIAKSLDAQAVSGGRSPVMTTPAVTETGVILGTAAYMSPEQARGHPVDQRTDIWAFGCLLFEMLTGQPAFGGEDVMLTLARVLDRETDLSSIPGTISRAVRHTIKLCLEKNPRKRIADIRDVRLALEGAFEPESADVRQSESAAPAGRSYVPLIAAAVAGAALTWLLSAGFEATPPREVRRSIHVVPADQPLNNPGPPLIAISPDGSRIAYGADGALYLRRLSELEARQVPGTAGEEPITPVFSPDGEWLLYGAFTSGELKRISTDGGTPITILPQWTQGGWRWDSDDMIRYGDSACQIRQLAPAGGTPELIVEEEGFTCFEPMLLPGGDKLLFERRPDAAPEQPEIAIRSLIDDETTVLFPGKQPQLIEPGYLVYFDST